MTCPPAILTALVLTLVAAAPAEGAGGWTWPLQGEVVTGYRNGTDPYAGGQHRGIDIAGPVGAPVVAAAGGSVRFAGTAGNSGLTVSIRTEDRRYDTSYLHLASVAVRAGQAVRAGERVGAVGTTGRRSATPPHLHFGVREAGSRTAYHDPLEFLRPAPIPRRRPVPPGAPAPVGAPARPAPAPLARPLPVSAPGGRRVPSPQRRPDLAPRPTPGIQPAPLPAPSAVRAPSGAKRPEPRGARRPVQAPAPSPQARPVAPPDRPLARPARAPAPGGPDLGLVLACLGLLAAAAVIGLRPPAREAVGRRHGLTGRQARPTPGV